MKNLYYLIAIFLGITFTSCDPLEDITSDLEKSGALDNVIIGEDNIILTDDDYDDLDLNFGNFNSVDDAKTILPEFLSDKYPVWGKGSNVVVAFNVYAPQRDEKSLIIYEVTTEDYDANPETEQYDNFNDLDLVFDFVSTKYPDPENRTLVSLTYNFYNGSTNEVNNGFLFNNGEWNFIQGFTEDEYAIMGEGFPNFSSEDEADTKIPIFLKDKFKYDSKQDGDIEAIMYKLYVGGGVTESYVKYFVFDGDNWSAYNNNIVESLQFGHDGTTWVPDNTIRYTLGSEDYTFIADELATTYPDATGSVGNYGNFDRRSGNAAFWSESMLEEAFNLLLNDKDPSAEEGQKYVVTYNIYNGSNTIESLGLIKESGSWILNN